jgi:hypothetical protein
LPANAVPLSSAFIPNNPCQINSLARLGDLHKFLVQCQDPGYFENYHQVRIFLSFCVYQIYD